MIDPISKNEIPLGSTASEVRDDIDIKVSEGEYLIPADVVRYLGLDKIEKLIEKAKEGIQEIDAKGRIGGDQGEEDFPFTPEELISQTTEDLPTKPAGMAVGGLVTQPAPVGPLKDIQRTRAMFNNTGPVPEQEPYPPLPLPSMQSMDSAADRMMTAEEKRKSLGMGGAVEDWEVSDYARYAKQRVDPASQLIQKGISGFIPFGGLLMKHRNNYLGKAVPENINTMLKSGVDRTGKSLTPEQRAQLQDTLAKISQPASEKGIGSLLGLGGLMKGLMGKGEGRSKEASRTEKPTSTTGSKSSDRSSTPTRTTSKSSSSTNTSGNSSTSKSSGGSISRRK